MSLAPEAVGQVSGDRVLLWVVPDASITVGADPDSGPGGGCEPGTGVRVTCSFAGFPEVTGPPPGELTGKYFVPAASGTPDSYTIANELHGEALYTVYVYQAGTTVLVRTLTSFDDFYFSHLDPGSYDFLFHPTPPTVQAGTERDAWVYGVTIYQDAATWIEGNTTPAVVNVRIISFDEILDVPWPYSRAAVIRYVDTCTQVVRDTP